MAMKKRNNEFLALLCNLYIVAMLVALPLYTGQGYWRLGNTKYMLFRNITVLCLSCWLMAGLPGRLRVLAERAGERIGERGAGGAKRIVREDRKVLSATDLAVAAYGMAVLLSALCSSYGQLPWRGYEGWFMGAFSQLLFVGIYFFVSRQYDGSLWPLYLGEAALFLATALGLLHRLGIDPLGLMAGWSSKDWEYSHMLSTLGNINWLCGYYSVALALPAAHFLLEKRRPVLWALYVADVLSLVLLGVQGSQGGLMILAVCVGAALIWGCLERRLASALRRLCLLVAGFCLCMPLMWQLMKMRGEKAAVVADGNVFDYVEWYVWMLAAAVCLVSFVLLSLRRRLPEEKSVETGGGRKRIRSQGAGTENQGARAESQGAGTENQGARAERPEAGAERPEARTENQGEVCQEGGGRKKNLRARILGTVGAAAGMVLFLCCLSAHPLEDGFGSGRGLLWRIALESFGQADWKDKLLGAGPDCYAEAVFIRLGAGTEVWKGEHWDGAVFTNAHNELLSQLCNVGLLGALSYLAIFLTAIWRYGFGDAAGRGSPGSGGGGGWLGLAGLLACAMYGAHALISFQQVLNTPLLFLVLGLCEARKRPGIRESGESEEKRYEVDEIQDKDSGRSRGYHCQHIV